MPPSPFDRTSIVMPHRFAFLLPLCLSVSLSATEYRVGPGQPLDSPNEVPWESLQPGDVVAIGYRKEPYRAKWVLCREGTAERPIVVRGIKGPDGERPIIEGANATTRSQLNFWSESRGVIKIGGANRPADTKPRHIRVEGLTIRGARPPVTFSGRNGITKYGKNAAAIFIEKGEHITIRDCVLEECGNGLFVASESSDIAVQNCVLRENGIEGSIYEHNSYTEAARITFEGNRYEPLRKGCGGSALKDRSSGLVVRYNTIRGGNRQLDLVDSGTPRILSDPGYGKTLVYGNLLIEPATGGGNNQIVHFGGDSGNTDRYRPGTLWFYHNTVVSFREGRTTLLRLSSDRQDARVFKNLVATPGKPGGGQLVIAANSFGRIELGPNTIRSPWRAGGNDGESVSGVSNVTSSSGPLLQDPERDDFRPLTGTMRPPREWPGQVPRLNRTLNDLRRPPVTDGALHP